MKKSGFTLVELLVVIAMLMMLAGAVTSSVASARRRARITKATVAVKEITNAILAYESYAKNGNPSSVYGKFASWQEASEGNLGFILGKDSSSDLGDVPVLYNGEIKGGRLLDPWGNPYYVKIGSAVIKVDDPVLSKSLQSNVYFPNAYRRGADEN